MKKQRYILIGLFALLITIGGLWKYYQVSAATSSDFFITYQSHFKSDGVGNFELTADEGVLTVENENGLEKPDSIRWYSSDEDVVTVTTNEKDKMLGTVKRKGPGYSKITAVVEEDNRTFTLTCIVKVDFKIDKSNTEIFQVIDNNDDVAMILNPDYKDKYTDKDLTVPLMYTEGSTETITAPMIWESEDTSVVSVGANNGKITINGAGETVVTVKTPTTLNGQPISRTLKVIVQPRVKDPTGSLDGWQKSVDLKNQTLSQPLRFVTNAQDASKLIWVVYDYNDNYKVVTDKRVTYSFDGDALVVSKAKFGKYVIRGYIKDDYVPDDYLNSNQFSKPGFITITLDVSLNIDNLNSEVIMNVGDTYSIVDNSNIPWADMFTYSSENITIADVDVNGIITAKKVGSTKIKLVFADSSSTDEYYITVKVIDGIALNYKSVKIYTGGTIKLNAYVTNQTATVVWSSDNPKVATVNKGLVTGVSQGTATITASQTINGVVKSASCIVYVEPSVTKITLEPSVISLNKTEKATITATIEPSDLNSVSLKWTSSNENVVKITDSYDLSAVIQGVEAGTAVITAINQDNAIVGFCQVTVKERVKSITLSTSSVTLSLSRKTYQLSAYVSPETATNKKVKWSSTNTKVATVDSNGLVTLVSGGTTTILAVSDDDPTVMAMCTITVEIPAASLTLDEKTKQMYVGDTYRLGYVITPTNAANKDVTWSSSNTSVVTVDSTGLIKAVGVGQAIITVKTSDGTLSATCTITVKQKATGISLDVTNLELYVGQLYELKVTVTPATSNDYTLTWESSNTTVATVDNNGKVTAVAPGKATITVKTSTGQIASCLVTVKQKATGLQLNYKEKTIVIGESFQIKATVVPSSAADEISVTWSSSKTSVATVSSTGVVKGKKGGTAIITCKSSDGQFTEYCVVTVVERVTSVTLNKSYTVVGLKKKVTLKATVKTNAATDPTIKWKSSNTRIATVDSKGRVTGKALGTVTITATAQDGSGEKDTCTVRVVRQATSITLNRTSVTTVEGRTFKLTAKVKPSNATYKSVKWTSSNEKVAIVDSRGQVTALSKGTVTITAAAKDNSSKKAACFVIVNPRTPANSVTIINQNLTMVVGETVTVQKAINPSNSTDRVTWQSDNKTVATVNATTGKVTARTPGIANITVMTESGKTATTRVTVVGLNTTHLTLEQYSTYQLHVLGLNNGVIWDVADNEIAVVHNGFVSARRTGTTYITATVNGRRLTCRLKVVKIR